MREIVLSTDNPHKLEEIREILSHLDVKILSKKDVGLEKLDVVEDKDTLEENAYLKAKAIYIVCHKMVIADDTGLFVNALNGAPGVYSARYAGEYCTEEDNREKMLGALKNVSLEKRDAYFETCILCIDEEGKKHSVFGRVEGKILEKEQGNGGFGYDALFLPKGYDKTFAQMTEEEKNACSHRRKALDAFVQFYEETYCV